ncbi:MAG TPA: hypothetical protein VJS66_01430, partial [Burkholderiales bacterium]|nr:hypothetical protein [Burkholderiales bacterium]
QVRQHYVRVNAPQARREYPQYTRPVHEVRRDWSPHRVDRDDGKSVDRSGRDMRVRHETSAVNAPPAQTGVTSSRDDSRRRTQHTGHRPQQEQNRVPNVRAPQGATAPGQSRAPIEPRTPTEPRLPIEPRQEGVSPRGQGDWSARGNRSGHGARQAVNVPRSGGMAAPSRAEGARFQAGVRAYGDVRRN